MKILKLFPQFVILGKRWAGESICPTDVDIVLALPHHQTSLGGQRTVFSLLKIVFTPITVQSY